MSTTPTPAAADPRIARCWRDALAVWDVHTTLSPPRSYEGGRGKSHWKGDEPLAYIDLETRQVVVNFDLLERMGASSSLTAVFAHEIGHHVRFPHTLGLAAALQVLEQRLIPGLKQSLTNLFFDLQVNELVGRTRAEELCAVYRGFLKSSGGETSPLFFFYLAVYEELWGLDPTSLVPEGMVESMDKAYPGWRADARMFVQTFYALTDVYLQFVYFVSTFIRDIPDPSKLVYVIPMGADVPRPDEDDFDAVVRGNGSEQADDALEEARERGWIEDSGLLDREEDDPLTTIDRITNHLPGSAQAAFRETMVSKHYKRLVDQYILKLPAVSPPPEAALPSVLEDWEWGESPRSIDWTGTILTHGPLAGAHPLRRDLLPDEPSPREQDMPAVEIYLDTSGSMPDPKTALNTMTLAAQILAASAIRKKGIVRGIVYSWGSPLVSDWMYDEETARRFLLHYAGGGTDYPFSLLKKFADERSDAIRVIVSDSDFLGNVQAAGAMDKLKHGIDRSRLLVAFLAAGEATARKTLEPVLRYPRFRLVIVHGLDQFARAAADLADAILGS
jgi:hypothetical protein